MKTKDNLKRLLQILIIVLGCGYLLEIIILSYLYFIWLG
jgi:hypothetical protein